MDLVELEKIKSSILNGLGYIVRLEKKKGNNSSKWFKFEQKKDRSF